MKELFDVSFSLVNIIPSALLIFILLYWITVFIGLIDIKTIDVNVDSHVDIDHDLHVDTDIHHDVHVEHDVHVDHDIDADVHHDTHIETDHISVNWFNQLLVFFNLGRIPFMVYLSFLILPMWIISVISNYYLNSNNSFLQSLLLFIPNFFVSLFIAKFLTTPFVRIFEKLDNAKSDTIVGKTGKVILPVSSDKYGQIEVIYEGSPIILTAKTSHELSISKGEEVLIIDFFKDKKCYIVEPC